MKWGPVAKKSGGGDVVGGAVALHRGFAGEVLVGWVDFALDDHAGGDAVDADLGGPGLGHGLGEHVERSLRGAVVSVGGPGMETTEGADVDDASAWWPEVRVSGFGHQKGGAGVGGEDRVPLLDGDFSRAADSKMAALLTRRSRRPKRSKTEATDS